MSFPRLGTRRLATGVFLAVEQIHLVSPDGKPTRRDVLRHPGGVGVLVVDKEHFIFVSQYRVALDRRVLEIPAGKLDRAGEEPESAARRELMEEVGVTAAEWVMLGAMTPSPGYTDEVIHLFAARGIVAGERRPDGAEEQDAKIIRVETEDAYRMLDEGEIIDAKTQIAMMAWARRMQ